MLAKSGVTEARKRLGADPVEWLFRKTGNQWGRERYAGDSWQGLQVLAIDGALLRTPDSAELREHFGSGNTSTECHTPFPMMRLVALMNVRSYLILDAQLSPYRRSEMRLAAVAFGRTPSDIRFKPVCQYIAVQRIVMAAANPLSATGRRLSALRVGVAGLFLDHRPRPSRPRTVKISKTRYPVDRNASPLK